MTPSPRSRRTSTERAEARAEAAVRLANRVELKKQAVMVDTEQFLDARMGWDIPTLQHIRDIVRNLDLELEQLVDAMDRYRKGQV